MCASTRNNGYHRRNASSNSLFHTVIDVRSGDRTPVLIVFIKVWTERLA